MLGLPLYSPVAPCFLHGSREHVPFAWPPNTSQNRPRQLAPTFINRLVHLRAPSPSCESDNPAATTPHTSLLGIGLLSPQVPGPPRARVRFDRPSQLDLERLLHSPCMAPALPICQLVHQPTLCMKLSPAPLCPLAHPFIIDQPLQLQPPHLCTLNLRRTRQLKPNSLSSHLQPTWTSFPRPGRLSSHLQPACSP